MSRQLATLVDRQHYLNQRLDAKTSARILDFYLKSSDPDHSLFLASEVESYKRKYGSNLGAALKAGDLKWTVCDSCTVSRSFDPVLYLYVG